MIQTYLNQILHAVYGKDVRQAIHDAINQCYEDGKSGQLDLTAREQIANLSNPNLLINSDFRNPVNQRGKKSYTGKDWHYSIDRWRTNNCDLTVTDSSITVTNTSTTDAHFQQVFENLHSDIYTGSCNVIAVNGTARMYHGTYSKNLVVGANSFTFKPSTDNFFEIILQEGASITLEWVKFERGNIATPFVPRLYGEELMLCQRYYLPLVEDAFILTRQRYDSVSYYQGLLFPIEMRITPAVTYESKTNDGTSLTGILSATATTKCIKYFNANGDYPYVELTKLILDAEIN